MLPGATRLAKFRQRSVAAILLLILLPISIGAQGLIQFDRLTIDDGLSQSTVNAILQDRLGFIWFGTQDGLNKYDGYRFTVYRNDSDTPGSISSNNITALLEDKEGYLWIGTAGGGLNVLDPALDLFSHYTHRSNDSKSISSDYIYAIFQDRAGSFWIGTADGVLNKLIATKDARDHFIQFFHDPDDSTSISKNDIVMTITEDRFGQLWVGTFGGGLNRFNPQTQVFTRYQYDSKDKSGIGDPDIRAVFEDSQGELWIGTFGGGLNRFDRDSESFIRYQYQPHAPHSLSNNYVSCIVEDDAKNLWIGTLGGGLNKVNIETSMDSLKFLRFLHDPANANSIIDNDIMSICLDNSGTLWAGALDRGLSRYHPASRKFITYRHSPGHSNSLSDNNVLSILEDSRKTVWVGTFGGGLDKFIHTTDSRGKRQGTAAGPLRKIGHYQFDRIDPQSLSSNDVRVIYEDSKNFLWIGTTGGGLNRFDPSSGKFTRFQADLFTPTSLNHKIINAICEDNQGFLWIGTEGGGLNRMNPRNGTFRHFLNDPGNPNSLSDNVIFSICKDGSGNLWVGTQKGGLNKLEFDNTAKFGTGFTSSDHIKFKHYKHEKKHKNSLSHNTVLAIHEDSAGHLWIGTDGGGLNQLNPSDETFRNYRMKDGLPNEVIYGILEDNNKDLWLSTNLGLTQFNRRNGKFRSYRSTDGLQSNEFNIGACFKNQEGLLFFGGINGFNAFDPDSVDSNQQAPGIVLTGLKILNREITVSDEGPLRKHISLTNRIKLSYRDNVFSIAYAALDYSNPGNNHYAYLLEGFDNDWIFAGTRREATYTNLDPGQYTFRVKGSNNDGVWNHQGVSLKINISPPFWLTLWFRMLVFLSASLIVLFLYRRKLTLVEQRRKELETVIANRTGELTEQKRIVEEQAAQLKDLDRMKSRFFTNLSHEFRTPLTLLIGPLSDFLKEDVVPQKRNMLNSMHRNAQRLLELVNQILDLAKLESGRETIVPVAGDIIAMLQEMVQIFLPFVKQKRIDLTFEANCGHHDTKFDRDKMQKIVGNLLSNAIKFTPESGRITVKAIVTCHFIEIKVGNTGQGIPANQRAHIFDRFYQADGWDNTFRAGSGVGLALVKELVNLHGGTISVNCEANNETEFFVRLPLDGNKSVIEETIHINLSGEKLPHNTQAAVRKAGEAEQLSDPKRDADNPPLILIIEDNADVRSYLKQSLRNGYRVAAADNGETGIEKAVQLLPDLIITDIMMPGTDGLAVTKFLKTRGLTSHIPIILLTARATKEDKIAGLDIQADDYLFKPFSLDELRARIRNLIEQRKQLKARYRREFILEPTAVGAESLDEKFLQNVRRVIEEHLDDARFNGQQLGRILGISRMQLHRKLRALTDRSTGQIIREIRLKRALQMLESGRGTVSEIAFEVGFNNLSYFAKCFREHFGKLPSDYKQSHL